MAAGLFDFAHSGATEPNILLFVLIDPGARALFGEAWADEAQRMVTQFRATTISGRRTRPSAASSIVSAATARSSRRGGGHEVRGGGTGRKVLHHPQRGRLSFAYATFQANDDPALTLAIYVPVDDA